MNPTDHIQLVTFQLAGLEPEAYRAHCEASAPTFAQIPGLRAKAWLANPATNTYGGVYAWESREAMEAYVSGPIFGREPGNGPRDDSRVRRPRAADRDHAPPVNATAHIQSPGAGRHQRGCVDSPRGRWASARCS
jgi:hypothetical protein